MRTATFDRPTIQWEYLGEGNYHFVCANPERTRVLKISKANVCELYVTPPTCETIEAALDKRDEAGTYIYLRKQRQLYYIGLDACLPEIILLTDRKKFDQDISAIMRGVTVDPNHMTTLWLTPEIRRQLITLNSLTKHRNESLRARLATTPDRAVRLWNLSNPHATTQAAVYPLLDPLTLRLASGQRCKFPAHTQCWTSPFVAGTTPSDEQRAQAVVALYIRTGRVFFDAPSADNILLTTDGEMVIVDADMELLRTYRRRTGSIISDLFWEETGTCFPSYWHIHHETQPLTVQAIIALVALESIFEGIIPREYLQLEFLVMLAPVLELFPRNDASLTIQLIALLFAHRTESDCIAIMTRVLTEHCRLPSDVLPVLQKPVGTPKDLAPTPGVPDAPSWVASGLGFFAAPTTSADENAGLEQALTLLRDFRM